MQSTNLMLLFLGFSLIVVLVTQSLLHSVSALGSTSVHSFCIQSCPLSEHVELYRAIVCGSSLSQSSIRSDFMQTGLIHLLVVSGQHYCFLEMVVEFTTRRLPTFLKWTIGLVVLGGFTLAAGASPPAVRAATAWSLRRGSDQLKLGWSRPQLVACSVALTLSFCDDMTDLLSLALSGTAAATLAFPWSILSPKKRQRKRQRKSQRNRLRSIAAYVKDAALLQTRLYFMLLPALCTFAIPHPLSILWNLIAGPVIGHLLFPMSLAGFFIPRLVGMVDRAWNFTIEVVSRMSAFTPRTPPGLALPMLFGVAYSLVVIGSSILLERRRRSVLLAAACLAFVNSASAQESSSELVVWNVGQGSWATVIETGRCTHFDMGGEFAPWEKIRASCEGVANAVLFSHWDWDHVSFAARASRTLLDVCVAARPGGSTKRERERILETLAVCPTRALEVTENTPAISRPRASSNASSRVFTYRGAVFPGDATKREEKDFRGLEPTRILLLAHHGSKTSTSESFLDRARPRMAIASARREKYGHPHAVVIARLKERGISLLRTEEWGSIRVQMKRPKLFELRPFAKQREPRIRACTPDTPC